MKRRICFWWFLLRVTLLAVSVDSESAANGLSSSGATNENSVEDKSKNPSGAAYIVKHSQIVCFDVDSTVIREEGIDKLAQFCGKEQDVARLTAEAMNGSIDYQHSLRIRLNIIQPNRQQIRDFLQSQPFSLSPDIKELFYRLRETNKAVYLVSGGFDCLIEPIARELDIQLDHIFANKLYFHFNGTYAGFDFNQPTSRTGGKSEVIKIIRQSLGQNQNVNITMIGDGATDAETSPPANNFIGYGGNVVRNEVRKRAKYYIINFQQLYTD